MISSQALKGFIFAFLLILVGGFLILWGGAQPVGSSTLFLGATIFILLGLFVCLVSLFL